MLAHQRWIDKLGNIRLKWAILCSCPAKLEIHETAKGLNNAGLMDIKTLHEFDTLCLLRVKEYNPK
jgi:hypothetical protein